MLLLSSLLGPAKPPVASPEDVASALGVHRVQKRPGSIVAAALDGGAQIRIVPGERCLVCLSEYENDEQVRQLNNCTHIFHKECIDEVRYCEKAASLSLWLMFESSVVDNRTQLMPALQRPGCG